MHLCSLFSASLQLCSARLILGGVEAAGAGAELNVGAFGVVGVRHDAVPEAGAAVDAFLAVE